MLDVLQPLPQPEMVDHLNRVQPVSRFGDGVVVRVPTPADARDDARVQQAMHREKAFVPKATYTTSLHVGTYIRSDPQSWLGRTALTFRCISSSGRCDQAQTQSRPARRR